jgi:hypothetical protein
MDNPVVALAFLSVFHLVGAATVAKAVRIVWGGLRGDKKLGEAASALPVAVWGAVFGCLPCGFGLQLATKEGGTPLVLFGEAAIWGSAFLIALLAGDAITGWLHSFFNADVALVAFGGLFMLTGTGVGVLVGRSELLSGLLVGGLFTLVGGVFFAIGLWNLLKETR